MDPSKVSPATSSNEDDLDHTRPAPVGLYEDLKREKADFKNFMESRGRALSGSINGLYGRLEYVCKKCDELIANPDELALFKADPFFNCSIRKPTEETLSRQMLYWFDDATTKGKRDRWSKAATVLEHLRSLGIGSGDVVGRIKSGGGIVKIYNSLPSAGPVDDGILSDHDILAIARTEPSSGRPGSTYLVEGRADGEAPLNVPQMANAAAATGCCPTHSGSDASYPRDVLPAASEGFEDATTAANEPARRPTSIREALTNNVLLRTAPSDKDIALTPGRIVVFAEATLYDDWVDVHAKRVIQLDNSTSPWPTLHFPSYDKTVSTLEGVDAAKPAAAVRRRPSRSGEPPPEMSSAPPPTDSFTRPNDFLEETKVKREETVVQSAVAQPLQVIVKMGRIPALAVTGRASSNNRQNIVLTPTLSEAVRLETLIQAFRRTFKQSAVTARRELTVRKRQTRVKKHESKS
jgi:hypothetical protein